MNVTSSFPCWLALCLLAASGAAAEPAGLRTNTQAVRATNDSSVDPDINSYQQAFRQLYEVCRTNYPCFELKGIDWKAVGEELAPRAAKIQSDQEFALLCVELIARLQDSHAQLEPGTAQLPRVELLPRWSPGIACIEDDRGDAIVYALRMGAQAEQAGVRKGMRVLKVNGVPAGERLTATLRRMKRYIGYSSERAARYDAFHALLREMEKGARMSLDMDDAEGSYHVELVADTPDGYLPRLPVPIPGIVDDAPVSWKRLKDDIGYIYVRKIMRNTLQSQLDAAVGALKGVRGMIIDVRGNSGGGFHGPVYLNFALDHPEAEPDRPRYKGPIALLLDARCVSAGEGWASWFIANKRARTFGQATTGASSDKATFPVKGGLYQVLLPIRTYKGSLDRDIEFRGLEPDVPLMPNAHDIAAGRDTVLEAAKAWLLSSAAPAQPQ